MTYQKVGLMVKGTPKIIHIPETMKKRLEEAAKKLGITESAFIMVAIDEKLRRFQE
jgi:predicted DNA-binding protein